MDRERWSRAHAATADFTPRRENAIRSALLAGYTVAELELALANVAARGFADPRSTDLPHILHPARLPAAIAGVFPIDWTDSPTSSRRRSPAGNPNTPKEVN